MRSKGGTKGALLREDQAAFLPLPEAPFEACRTKSTAADRLSLVRFEANDYSVPVRYAHHPVVVKGFVDRVVICCRDAVIAEHERLWGKEGIQLNPLHYLELLERKPGALDYARPLEEWELPECFHRLRGRLTEDGNAQGTREYIRVLRLLEKHPLDRVARAIEKVLTLRRCSRDVVAQYLYGTLPRVLHFSTGVYTLVNQRRSLDPFILSKTIDEQLGHVTTLRRAKTPPNIIVLGQTTPSPRGGGPNQTPTQTTALG